MWRELSCPIIRRTLNLILCSVSSLCHTPPWSHPILSQNFSHFLLLVFTFLWAADGCGHLPVAIRISSLTWWPKGFHVYHGQNQLIDLPSSYPQTRFYKLFVSGGHHHRSSILTWKLNSRLDSYLFLIPHNPSVGTPPPKWLLNLSPSLTILFLH